MRRRRSSTLVILALLAASGCGGGTSSGTSSPTRTVDSGPPTTPTTTPTTTDSTSPTAPGTTTTPPAPTSSSTAPTGPTLSTRYVRVTLPAGWKKDFQSGTQADGGGPPPGHILIFVSDISSFGSTIKQDLAYELRNQPTLRRQADLTVDGVRGYVLAGKRKTSTEWFFGTVYRGQAISVALSTYDPRGFDEAVAAISASIDFK